MTSVKALRWPALSAPITAIFIATPVGIFIGQALFLTYGYDLPIANLWPLGLVFAFAYSSVALVAAFVAAVVAWIGVRFWKTIGFVTRIGQRKDRTGDVS